VKVLDTDTCIEILRGNAVVIARRRAVTDSVATTWVTAAELYYGAARSSAPEKNHEAVSELLSAQPVLGLSDTAARAFGEVKASLERQGRRLADADLLIASIAIAHGAEVVTGNRKHYGRIPGLVVEDWIR